MTEITGATSDGFHTFDELYRHRSILFVALMRSHPALSWFSAHHEDGSMFPGFFIAGMDLPTGQVTYHLQRHPWWDILKGPGVMVPLARAPIWDGHDSDAVITRVKDWLAQI